MPRFNWSQDEVFLVADRAYSMYQQGRYREAAVLFEGLTAVDPDSSYCANAQAACLYLLGEHQKVVAATDRFLARRPNDNDARARRCESLLALSRVEEARKEFEALRNSRANQHVRRLQLRFDALRSNLLPAS